MKKLFLLMIMLFSLVVLVACADADIVSKNISKDADYFKIMRKIVFYNVITGDYMFAIEGYCSIYADTVDEQLEVTCKTADETYEKHFLGVSDNVSYMVLQLNPVEVSAYHYKIYLKPESLIPDIEIVTEGS